MPLIFNRIGAAMVFLAMFGLVVSPLLGCLILLVVDVGYRLKNRDRNIPVYADLLATQSGGHVFFIPCWAWGIILPIAARVFGWDAPVPSQAP